MATFRTRRHNHQDEDIFLTITVYLPLWKRPLHSLRWMWHANRTSFPFPILIGDGGDEPVRQRVLEEKKNFPNLNYTYLKYEDRSVDDFTRKCVDVLSRVTTPYACWCDDDDFMFIAGMKKAAEALDNNLGASSAGGWIGTFALYPEHKQNSLKDVNGEMYRYTLFHKKPSVLGKTAAERVCECLLLHRSIWQSVHRKDSFLNAFERFKDSGIQALDIQE